MFFLWLSPLSAISATGKQMNHRHQMEGHHRHQDDHSTDDGEFIYTFIYIFIYIGDSIGVSGVTTSLFP